LARERISELESQVVGLECDLDVMRGARKTVAELKAIKDTLIAAGLADDES
jgi:hypothetical protein